MPIAADYPFLDILWSMIIFFTWVVWIWIMIVILTDVFRRNDIGGWSKALWVIFLIILPFLGALVYLIAHHDGMAQRSAGVALAQVPGERRCRAGAFAGGGGRVGELRLQRGDAFGCAEEIQRGGRHRCACRSA